MLTPIDYYITAKYGQIIMPVMTKEVIKNSMEGYFGFKPTDWEFDYYLKISKPPKHHIVHALKSRGFSQNAIAKFMGVTSGAISQQANKPIEGIWMNPNFRSHMIARRSPDFRDDRAETFLATDDKRIMVLNQVKQTITP